MTTSRTTLDRSEMEVRATRPPAGYAYMRTRNKLRAFTLVNKEFEKASITQAELARRLGKRPDRVSRLLNAPGNWTLDTVSDLLFAISGAEVKYQVRYPHRTKTDGINTSLSEDRAYTISGPDMSNFAFRLDHTRGQSPIADAPKMLVLPFISLPSNPVTVDVENGR